MAWIVNGSPIADIFTVTPEQDDDSDNETVNRDTFGEAHEEDGAAHELRPFGYRADGGGTGHADGDARRQHEPATASAALQ